MQVSFVSHSLSLYQRWRRNLCALYFAGSKACRADMHFLPAAIDLDKNLLDIGVPDSV